MNGYRSLAAPGIERRAASFLVVMSRARCLPFVLTVASLCFAAPASADPAPRAKTAPLVRAVTWICQEQSCEGGPVLAYDYLPAVSADGKFVAHVEERDGWGHTKRVGVRVTSTETGESADFFPVVVRARDMTTMEAALRHKGEHEALIRAANAGLAAYDFRPLFPETSSTDCGAGKPGCARRLVPELAIDVVSKDEHDATSPGIAKVIVRQGGKEMVRVDARDWDPESGCSTRAFGLLGARADAHVAVFLSTIVMTGHNCDGVVERQPWAIKIGRW